MLRKLLGRGSVDKYREQTPEARGYLRPLKVEELLNTENAQKLLKQIRDNSLMTREGTERYYLQSLRQCVNLMQQLPVTEKEHHAVVGGLVDFTLKTVAYALRLSRGQMLPKGSGAEKQSAQAATWNAVIFYAALSHSLTVFGQLEGELSDGTPWYPGLVVPSKPYRLRFCEGREERAKALAILLGMRLLPEEVVVWLGRTPVALDTLLRIIRGEAKPGCAVLAIISKASELAGGPPTENGKSSQQDTPAPMVAGPLASAVQPEVVIPSTGEVADGNTSDVSGNDVVLQPVSEKGEQAEPATGDVLTLMGFGTENTTDPADFGAPVETPGNQPDRQDGVMECVVSEDVTATRGEDAADENYGSQFLSWLLEQINTGSLTVNNNDSSLHVVSGLLFVPVPGIFRDFLRENKMQPRLRKKIQSDFESLGVHFAVKGKGLYSFQRYPEEGKVGDPEAQFGYLIKIRKIAPEFSFSEDSKYVFIASKYNM